MEKHKNKIPLISTLLYLITIVTAVSYTWLSGLHLFDLSLSFSAYVGMHYGTALLYFIALLIVIPLLMYYIIKSKLPPIKIIVYSMVFFGIFLTALFPSNRYSDHPSEITIALHKYAAMLLMVVCAASFAVAVVLAKNKRQKITAVIALSYSVVFVVLYLTHFKPLFSTFFIWENLFIVLLFVQLHTEQYGEIT